MSEQEEYEEYDILYDWEPEVDIYYYLYHYFCFDFFFMCFFYVLQKDEDLPLIAGEIVQVIEKHDHGWWFGQIKTDGNVVQGYFPRNYIKEKPRARNVPKPPPRPASLQTKSVSIAEDSEVKSLAGGLSQTSISSSVAGQRSRNPRTFSLRSLVAFDELSQQGYTVDVKESDKGMLGESPTLNSLVELKITGMVWDGAQTFTNTFIEGCFRFVVGKHNVVAGIQLGVQTMVKGQHATITCAPNMAYGIAGNPPFVPPNAFIVFELEVLSVSNPADFDTLTYDGPLEWLSSGVATTRIVKVAAPQVSTVAKGIEERRAYEIDSAASASSDSSSQK
jgi:hypothetical protein